MPQAARLNDPIGHSPSMNWLLKGVVAGAAIGLGAVAIVGTGGLAAAALVGGLAAGGAGIGEMMSTMSWAPKEVCGVIKGACSGNVYVNGIPAARAHVDVVDCHKHSPPYPPIATGSATVFINGQPAARVNDKAGCSAIVTDGSHNVFIGGDTVQTDVLYPENLVPAGVHTALLVVGVGSAIVLGGPIVAAVGLAGGVAGQFGGEWIGGKAFGVGSDGQKWTMLGGSLLGGAAGAKGGASLAGKWLPRPLSSTQGFIKGGLQGLEEAAGNRYAYAKQLAEKRVEEIRAAPDELFPNARKPLKTSIVIDKKTGKVYQGDSGYPLPRKEDIHLALKERIPNPSLEERHIPENCAEFKAANNALNDGAQIENLEIYTVKTNKSKTPAHRCANCQVTTEGAKVYTDEI